MHDATRTPTPTVRSAVTVRTVPVTLDAFDRRAIPHAEWDHRAHVTVAYLSLRAHGLDGALTHVRAGIQAYNAAHGIAQTPDGGYHDTLTIAWVRIIHAVMTTHGALGGPEEFFEANSYLLSQKLPRLYYSRERIMSWAARTGWLEPDVSPLPTATQPGA